MTLRALLPTMSTSAVAAAMAATFAIGAAAAEPRIVTVEITKFAFTPKDVTVAPGTKVVWTNHDDTPHTVAANDKTFASKGLDTDDRFEFVFPKEGDYAYICTVHPFMTGVVHVKKP